MRCPLNGKPCIMPKEIFVTEVKPQGVKHLYMCRICGDDYIKNLSESDVISKNLEVISEQEKLSADITDQHIPQQPNSDSEPDPQRQQINHIKKIEAKMQAAIDEERYEDAAKLKDILEILRRKNQEIKDSDSLEDSGI